MTKKTSKDYLVLSALYKLLAEFDADSLLAASESDLASESLRKALYLLAEEARGDSTPGPSKAAPGEESGDALKLRERRIYETLLDRELFPSTASIVTVLRATKVSARYDARQSRTKWARTVAKAVAKRPESTKRFEDYVARLASDGQTAGWLSVIKG
ncbi:MAG: hypothetical protein AB7H96_24695 [Vicinamibacterales bacterium]